jgi:hypothetical protein
MTSAVAKLAGLLVPLLLCSQTSGGLHRMDQLGSAHLEARSTDLRESAGRLALVNVTLGQVAQFARPVEEAGQLRLSLDPIPGITARVRLRINKDFLPTIQQLYKLYCMYEYRICVEQPLQCMNGNRVPF